MAQQLPAAAPKVREHPAHSFGWYAGATIVGVVLAVIAAFVTVNLGSDAEVASVSHPPAQVETAAVPEIIMPKLNAAQLTDAARWTALANNYANSPALTAAQITNAARWTALANSYANSG